jgi:anti-anti-sigma factor
VLFVRGEVDIGTVATLEAAIAALLDSRGRDIWIDLSEVRFLECRGVLALLKAQRAAERGHRYLAVICPTGPVRRVFELTGLDREVPIFHSRVDAHLLS